MKKQLLTLTLAVALALPIAQPVSAAQGSVKVHLPDFKVTLNGTVVDNNYSKYPLIVYNDITYFPMTYYDCRFLGLETAWESSKTGLFINATGIQGSYNPYKQSKKNSRNSTAQIASFPITVNGQSINNAKEKYPLLIYRDVTYFPMTWRFGVEEFNWQYHFDTKTGLVINSTNTATAEAGNLPEQTKDAELKYAVVTDGDYVYYVGGDKRDKIMCAPLSDLKKAKKIYDIPENYMTDSPCYPALYVKNGQAMMNYHIGGGFMGSMCYFTLSPDGAKELGDNNYITVTSGANSIRYYIGNAPDAGNLQMKQPNGDWKTIGADGYIFGWNWKNDGKSLGGNSLDCYYLRYDNLYIPGYDMTNGYKKAENKDYSETTGIYRVNIKTNETVRISPAGIPVANFTNGTQYLYYIAANKAYRYDMISGTTDTIPLTLDKGYAVNAIQATASGNAVFVYATDGSHDQLYLVNENDRTIKLKETAGFESFTTKGDYAVVTFAETPENPYRILVIDNKGKVVFKSADTTQLNSTYITLDTFYYFNHANMQMCYSKLK